MARIPIEQPPRVRSHPSKHPRSLDSLLSRRRTQPQLRSRLADCETFLRLPRNTRPRTSLFPSSCGKIECPRARRNILALAFSVSANNMFGDGFVDYD